MISMLSALRHSCIRNRTGRVGSRTGALLAIPLLVLLLGGARTEAWAADDTVANHYIVLFDASGSMKRAHKPKFNYWAGQAGNNRALARRLAGLVKKAVTDTPEGFPRFSPDRLDLFSFMLFNLDPKKLSYAPGKMLLTNERLVLAESNLPPADAYQRFDNSERRGIAGSTIALKDAMKGFSPLVAATGNSLPFLGSHIDSAAWGDPRVGRIFIIRITDGRYSSDANASDEYAAILRQINFKRPKANKISRIEGYQAFVERNRQVTRVFEIASRRADCALVTHYKNNKDVMELPFNCKDGAFQDVFDEGKGFYVTYLEVQPKAESVVDNAYGPYHLDLELESLVRDGEIRLVEDNPIRAERNEYADGLNSIEPSKVRWRQGGDQEWIDCGLEGDSKKWARCHGGEDGNRIDLPLRLGAEPPYPRAIRYRFEYDIRFNRGPEQVPLYPFTKVVEPATLEVTLGRSPLGARIREIPAATAGAEPAWWQPPSPGRFFDRKVTEPPAENLTDQGFLEKALTWEEAIRERFGDGDITPRMVERVANTFYGDYRERETRLNEKSAWFWPAALVAAVLGFALWPRRRLLVDPQPLATDGVALNFGAREHERVSLLGTVVVTNEAKGLRKAPFRSLTIGLADSSFKQIEEGAAGAQDLPIKRAQRAGAPLAVGRPRQSTVEERRVWSGREYPVYFDPEEVEDLELEPDDTKGLEFQVPVFVEVKGPRVGPERVQLNFPLVVKPELGELDIRGEGIGTGPTGEACVPVEYHKGERARRLCSYRLTNRARHRFSTPVSGEVRIQVSTRMGKAADYLVFLHDDQGHPAVSLPYRLTAGQELEVPVVADFTRLHNPVSEDEYFVRFEVRKSNGDRQMSKYRHSLPRRFRFEVQESNGDRQTDFQTVEGWTLLVRRSTQRTDVSMQVRASNNPKHRSPALNRDRPVSDQTFPVGTPEKPVDVAPQAIAAQNKTRLFQVRLFNACRDGHGHAFWRADLRVKDKTGLTLQGQDAIRLLDGRGQPLVAGKLMDSDKENEHSVLLTAEMGLSEIHILRRDMRLAFQLRVDWTLHPEGDLDPDRVETFTTELPISCILRHKPPADTLAIDFGTSALAVAHATGTEVVNLLPLQQKLKEIAQARGFDPRFDDTQGSNPFLSSECNVALNDEQLKELMPTDTGFLQLPLHTAAVAGQSDKVFSSLKAMISAGFKTLPLDAQAHPYKNSRGLPESLEEPPLDEVILGAYQGLLRDYLDPLLRDQRKGFSHIYVTHPNTYTRNHVQQLRRILERLVEGRSEYQRNLVYRDNIHFFSESDAVAYYYLVNAKKYHGSFDEIPPLERILVYDIGAGTLDLTHLEVRWEPTEGGRKSPGQVKVIHRGGVALAGDRLDECIARDIHTRLDTLLDAERYVNPIVVPNGTTMDRETRRLMDDLRQQIHQLKVDLSEGGGRFRIQLAGRSLAAKLVESRADETPALYKGIEGIAANIRGEVFLHLSREQILAGSYVQAFLHQVTKVEVIHFFGGTIPDLDTLLLSGRTSLWPGFAERLKETLSEVLNWVDFDRDSDVLKKAVVIGALERAFRWEYLAFQEPGTVGEFGVRYESSPHEWEFRPYPNSGQVEAFDLRDATQVEIGLRTNNGFNLCFALRPADYYGADHRLSIRLEFDEQGYLTAQVINTEGREWSFSETTNIPTLDYSTRPWPLGTSKLVAKAPDELFVNEKDRSYQ